MMAKQSNFTTTTLDPKAASQVFYDGGCPVCSREIALYQRLSANSTDAPAFCNVASGAGRPADDLSQEDALARLHVRRADGQLVSGAAAFLALWRATPRFRLLGRALSVPPFPWLLEQAYRGFLVLRRFWR
jgi:predicted DCC family thiol-disulfide oxidoreductase YuxK